MSSIVYVVTKSGKNILTHSDIFNEKSAKKAQEEYTFALNNFINMHKNQPIRKDEIIEDELSRCCCFYKDNKLLFFISISRYKVR